MATIRQAIGYVRVSTKDQGSKRNGLESQIEHIKSYSKDNGYELIAINEEVMSGGLGLTYREVLKDTIETCCKTGATLLVSKLDRLGRDWKADEAAGVACYCSSIGGRC
jgi:DNA invertase Pin-like site-specific DNA recombinase